MISKLICISKVLLIGLFVYLFMPTQIMANPKPVEYVNIDRYMGKWYVIRNIPYFLEKNKVASYDTYSLRADGKITNNFTFREKTFLSADKTWNGYAQIIDSKTNAIWKVSFLWPIYTTYVVFALDTDYTWAVVGTKDAGLLWVLSRSRKMDASVYAFICEQLHLKGISTEKLQLVPQPDI
jgi:apolipoprotein D and lipocalin family protein